jgi:4-amino-4-deoxy-L-arabinose transferase-like glycosyltransferase
MISFLSKIAFVVALIAIGWNIQHAGIATGYIDSVRKLGAQDEAVYTREAIHMATQGRWLTQTFLDRYVLFKPPLLMWLSGLTTKIFGISSLPIRLPALLAGAFVCLLAFRMSRAAPWAAVILLLSDRLFHTLARVNMTDILLLGCLVLAFYSFSLDTTLRNRRAFYGFALGIALAILTKSIAGLLPFVVVGVFWLIARPENKPRIARVAQAGLVALAIILPWHLYQIVAHYEWFLAEYLGVQLLAFGAKPPQTSQENQILFYLTRLVYTDPELSLIALLSLPSLVLALRKRTDTLAILLSAWLLVFSAALLIFQYRSVQYMLPLIPALAMVAASYLPALRRRTTIVILCAAFAAKAAKPDALWGLSYASGNTLPTAAALANYCEQHRATDLIVLDPEDEFYSAVLPLHHVRYGWVDPNESNFALQPHLHWLGITETADEFRAGARYDLFAQRLRSWGLGTATPIGTAIFGHSVAEIQQLIAARPESDFLVPRTWLNPDSIAAHDIAPASRDRVFLLSKTLTQTFTPRWSCKL